MLFVRTALGASTIHGIGLFAAQFIHKGAVTWRYTRGLDKSYSAKDIERMTPSSRAQFLKYSYFDKRIQKLVLPFDDLRFINHCARHPNILSTPRIDVAARDIEIGEELTCNYNDYDDAWFARLGLSDAAFVVEAE